MLKMDELIAYVFTIFYIKKRRYYFTGTPSGVAAVKPNDILEGFLETNKLFRIQVK
jgi:2-keto-4-pentenoate hydratase/2-oxohepta-3-ene-1,7-dioic acid hydratase in catechol pathway